ncbi:MAG TPA: PspC domain-containing protein [Candidatus Limnocylindrales bacterium]|jgi:phage shock protein PspC (stress-responsive transcriptional regulator)
MNRRLYRSADDRVLAGVAGGMAETYDFDPALVRVAWALLILFSGGVFLILYIIMAIVIPLAPDTPAAGYWPADGSSTAPQMPGAAGDEPTTIAGPSAAAPPMSERERRRMMRHQRRAEGGLAGPVVFGLILILVGGFFLLRQYVPAIDWGQIWPIGLIALGAVLVIAALAPRSRV